MKYLFILIVMLPFFGNAQGNGARLFALGGALSPADAASTFQNPAALSRLEHSTVAITHEQWVNGAGIKRQMVAAAAAFSKLHLGVAAEQNGFEVYKTTRTEFAVARKFGNFSLGISAGAYMLQIQNYGKTTAVSVQAAITYEIRKRIVLSSVVSNPHQALHPDSLVFSSPVQMAASVTWKASDKVEASLTGIKSLTDPLQASAAVEYQPSSILHLRAANYINPMQQVFGMGFNMKGIGLDVAYSFGHPLGSKALISLSYEIGR